MSILYKSIIRPLLFQLSADQAHQLALSTLEKASKSALIRSAGSLLLSYKHPSLNTKMGGLIFKNPIGLPAGFDPNGAQAPISQSLGFGFATIGSVTLQEQNGNPRPHFFRLKKDQSLIVNKGLMNKGAKKIANNIRRFRRRHIINCPLGISIARTTAIPKSQTIADYVKSFELLAPYADYVEINISCPNVAIFSPEEQVKYIKGILMQINSKRQSKKRLKKPIWLKLGCELSDYWNEKMIEICIEENVDAIILSNLVKDRSILNIKSKNYNHYKGGVSGKLLAPLSEKKLRFFYKRLKGKIPLISTGGIFTAEDVYRRIKMGASMVQILTGWIYEGPGSLKKINKKLVQLVKQDGYKNISEAIGIGL